MARKVGVEPSGDAFNAISLHQDDGRPLNPMIYTGAIATTGQIIATSAEDRFDRILAMFGRHASRALGFDGAAYESAARTGHRNRAIGHLLRNYDILIDEPTPTVDVHFRQCSILVTCHDLAVMAAACWRCSPASLGSGCFRRGLTNKETACGPCGSALSCRGRGASTNSIRHTVRRRVGGIRVIDLQGVLSLATAEPVVREVLAFRDGVRGLIVDFQHTTGINAPAAVSSRPASWNQRITRRRS